MDKIIENPNLAKFSDDSIEGGHQKQKIKDVLPSIHPQPFTSTSATSKLSRESEAKLMDLVIVNNEKVRYYYNKTLCLREPIGNMLDLLEVLHSSTFAYLSQLPETGDYSVISTLFELIPTISVMIDWDNLNHSCYWEDFCRETKNLQLLLDRVNGVALKCSDIATELLHRAQELFQDVVSSIKKPTKIDRAIAFRKESDYTHDISNGHSLQLNWEKPKDTLELMWHDADGGLLNVPLKQTGTGFRIRFLRHIIYHARGLLEKAYLVFMKLSISLTLHIPIEKLAKCRDVNLKQLTGQEYACLAKAKREFDSSLDLVWQLISRFKFQTFHLLKYSLTFKGMRKASGFTPQLLSTFGVIKMSINDSLLMRVMSSGIQAQANEESFDFTIFPDRTEDIIAKIEDLLVVDNSTCVQLRVLSALVRIMLPPVKPYFTVKERESTYDEIERILGHRFQVRRLLKKALQIFEKHSAFNKMEQLKLLTPVKHVSRKVHHSSETTITESSAGSESQLDENGMRRDINNNMNLEQGKVWISVEGGIKVTIDCLQGILTKSHNNSNAVKKYSDMGTNEKVILCIRLIRQLLVCIANEQCSAKVSTGRILETKSLVKRLKIKDRQNTDLQKAVLDQNMHLRLKLQLTKNLRFLK